MNGRRGLWSMLADGSRIGEDTMRNRVFVSTLIGALSFAAPPPASSQSDVDAERLARIPARMQELVDDGTIAGAVMLLARRDTVLMLEAVGYADVASRTPMQIDHIFRVASISKPTTAVGVMILQEEGVLTIGDYVARHLPEFRGLRVENPGPRSRPPVIRELMTHTSGLDSEWVLFDHDTFFRESLETVVTGYTKTPLAYEPGTRQVYSSPGFDTLGRIIEVISGQSFESFMQARVFRPLGMHDTSFFVEPEDQGRVPSRYWHEEGELTVREPSGLLDPDRRFPAPAFGMFSTAADMGALMRMMLNGGTHEGRRVLSENAVGAMTTNQVRADSLPARGLGWTVGGGGTPDLDFSAASETTFGHGASSGAVAWADSGWDLAGVLLIHQADQDARHARRVFAELAFAAIIPGGGARPKGR
jgi:CubicO group peptidase (beta-lactamase class C family)